MIKLKLFLFIFLFAITAFCKDFNAVKLVSDGEANLIKAGQYMEGDVYGRQTTNQK